MSHSGPSIDRRLAAPRDKFHHLAKVSVARSNPVIAFRSISPGGRRFFNYKGVDRDPLRVLSRSSNQWSLALLDLGFPKRARADTALLHFPASKRSRQSFCEITTPREWYSGFSKVCSCDSVRVCGKIFELLLGRSCAWLLGRRRALNCWETRKRIGICRPLLLSWGRPGAAVLDRQPFPIGHLAGPRCRRQGRYRQARDVGGEPTGVCGDFV